MNLSKQKSKRVLYMIEKRVHEKYDEELEREKSLLEQASNMQTAFSIISAALFMLLPVLLQYTYGTISLQYYFVAVSVIVAFLLLSLVFATLAQWREMKDVLPDVKTMMNDIENKLDRLVDDESIWFSDSFRLYETMQQSLAKLNKKRCALICASMICFFAALFACFLSYLIGVALFLPGGGKSV